MSRYAILCLMFFCKIVSSRDFYAGMFSKNDFLVAQDRLYKERAMYRTTYAKYGRHFKCPITYFRVQDRLGMGRGPRVEVIRGGLRHNFLVMRLTSVYNLPISVNVYVGCENKKKPKLSRPQTTKKSGEAENKKHTTASPGVGGGETGTTSDSGSTDGKTGTSEAPTAAPA